MFERHIQLHRLTLTVNLKWNSFPGISPHGEQVGEVNFLVKRIDIISVLIEFRVADCANDITNMQASLLDRCARLDASYVNPAASSTFARVLSELRIAGRKVTETNRRKALVVWLGCVF